MKLLCYMTAEQSYHLSTSIIYIPANFDAYSMQHNYRTSIFVVVSGMQL